MGVKIRRGIPTRPCAGKEFGLPRVTSHRVRLLIDPLCGRPRRIHKILLRAVTLTGASRYSATSNEIRANETKLFLATGYTTMIKYNSRLNAHVTNKNVGTI